MQKSKGLLKKSCAWFLTFATVLTTMSSTGIASVFAEESTDDVETEAQVTQDTASQDTSQTPSVTQGSIYVKLNEGGTVVVFSDSGTKTVEKSDGKVTVKDSNNVSVDVTDSLVNDYYLVATEEVGNTVTINTTAKEGYSIEMYRILTDSGEVAESTDDFATLSSSYTHDTTVTETSKYIEVGFKAEEVEDTEVEEIQSVVEDLSSDDEDWRQQAEADPNWLCAGGELLTPEEMQEAYLELGLLTSDTSYYSKLYRSASAGTAGTITYYQKVTAEGSTVGTFEVNNQIAFCCDHKKKTPAKGTSVSSLGEEGNENLRKVLYYGYNGPGSIVGTSTSDHVYTTLCVSGALGTLSMGKDTTNYYNNLISQPAPPSSFTVTLWSTGNSSYQRLATWDYNPKGILNIKKVPEAGCADIISGNNMYSLEGAVFNVYSDSALTNLVAQVTSDFNGNTSPIELDAGDYYITEEVAPKGFEKATGYRTATVTSGGTNNFEFADEIQGDPAGIVLMKQPNSSMSSAAGNTRLQGAEYTVKYYDNDSWSGEPKRTWVYKTDNLGVISMQDPSYLISGTFYMKEGHPIFLSGTYSVQETKAPTGYNLDNNIYQATVLNGDDWQWTEQSSLLLKAYNSANGDTAVNEQVWKGSVKVHKEDIETGDALQGNSSHEGITFTIVNKSANSVSYDGNIIPVDGVVTTITTDANGDASTPEKSLEYGTYEIYESSTNLSMTLSDTNHYTFSITSDGQVVTLSTSFKDEVVRGGVQVTKYDKELNKSESLGGATLEGIDFEITNQSANSVIVDSVEYQPGQVVKTITTHWNKSAKAYTAETSNDCLPYGTYTIKEVKTNDSYLLTDGNKRTFTIRENGKIVTTDTKGVDLIWRNQVVRGDAEFVKIADSTSKRISAPFIITNKETGEQHVIVTDVNGQYNTNSSWNKHSEQTNANDWIIETLKSDPTHCFTSGELVSSAGVWFGEGEFDSMADVNDSLGALPYGDYILSEVRCDANATYELQNFEFTVYKDSVTVDLGTVTDDVELEPTISTVATDSETGRHVSRADKEVTINDTVRVTGLVIGETYTIKGKVMDYDDENVPITITNADGKRRNLKSEVTFVANNVSMDVVVPFKFDGSNLANKTGVCYEGLYKGTKLLVEEADIDNADQAFHFPTISTEARDYLTKDNVGSNSNSNYRVVDKVRFTNLVPGEVYVLKGVLYNKKDGSVVAKSQAKFLPENADGSTNVYFKFTSDVQGKDLVAFEELYANDAIIAEHKDLEDDNQTVHYPEIGTTALDDNTKSHVGTVSEETTITDTVSYSNLVVGKEYTIQGKLMNKETGEEISGVTAEKTFTAERKEGTVELTFTVDSSKLAGKTVVAFEDLYHNNVNVATHSNINDEEQTVYFPEITTNAIDSTTGDKVGVVGKTEIADTVHCTNLVVGQEYTVSGILMDKGTKEYLGKDLGMNKVTASTTFVASKTTEDVKVIFKVDASQFANKTAVVYEDLLTNGVVTRSHRNLNDVNQTVQFSEAKTIANGESGLKEINAEGAQTIKDEVSLNNLVVGDEYTVKGTLVYKDTGSQVIIDGAPVTSENTVTAEGASATVDMSFTIKNTDGLKGETIVVFEDIYHNGVKVTTHSDLNDVEQTVRFPKVETNATDNETTIDESLATSNVNLTDTVKYYNLEAGTTYTVKGTLVDKATGEPVTCDGKYVVGTTTFVAGTSMVLDSSLEYVDDLDEALKSVSSSDENITTLYTAVNGSVGVSYNIDATELKGKTIVMYEYLYRGDVLIGSHKDIKDENQDIKFIKIGTEALDKETKSHESNADDTATIVDTVSYSNATVGNTYKLVATLMDKNSGEPIVIDGKEVVVEKTFTAKDVEGSVDVEIPINATSLEGKSVVVFENMYNSDKLVAVHADITDEGQTIHFAKVTTKAIDKTTGFAESESKEKTTLVDTVTYSNLTEGETYTIKGVLMDKETKEPIKVNGETVVSEKEITAGSEDADETINGRVTGDVDLEFNFDSNALAGKTIVVFEEIYSENGLVGHHTDIEDENQTVTIPKISTTATDETTGTHEQQATKEAKITDRVDYVNLKPGKEYTVKGILMDKKTNKPLLVDDKEITSKVTFTPEKANGYVGIEFTFDSSALAGKDIVAFETLYREGKEVAVHTDIEDKDQTVSVIDISTTATDETTGTHEMTLGDNVVLSDKVDYINLTVNSKYTIKGSVIDKESGNVIANAETEFTPVNSTDATNVEFNINTNALQGKTLVVYEELYNAEGVLVAVHKDINDANQTVTVPVAPVIPQTTDNYGWMYAIGAILFILGIAVTGVVYRRKRKF